MHGLSLLKDHSLLAHFLIEFMHMLFMERDAFEATQDAADAAHHLITAVAMRYLHPCVCLTESDYIRLALMQPLHHCMSTILINYHMLVC